MTVGLGKGDLGSLLIPTYDVGRAVRECGTGGTGTTVSQVGGPSHMRRAFRHINGAKYRDPVIDELPGGAPNKVYILCSVNVTRPRVFTPL